jgi:hypothetical protein
MMVSHVNHCLEEKIKIIYVDEAIFSPQTRLARSWSSEYSNIHMPDNRDKLVTQAVIAGISQEEGLEAYLIKEHSIDQNSFMEFI